MFEALKKPVWLEFGEQKVNIKGAGAGMVVNVNGQITQDLIDCTSQFSAAMLLLNKQP